MIGFGTRSYVEITQHWPTVGWLTVQLICHSSDCPCQWSASRVAVDKAWRSDGYVHRCAQHAATALPFTPYRFHPAAGFWEAPPA